MRAIDHDWFGKPIYDPLDVMAQNAALPVFYASRAKRCFWCDRQLAEGQKCHDPIEMESL